MQVSKFDPRDDSQFKGDAERVPVFINPVEMMAAGGSLKVGDLLVGNSEIANSAEHDGQPVFEIVRLETDVMNAFQLARRFVKQHPTAALDMALKRYVSLVEQVLSETAPEKFNDYRQTREQIGLSPTLDESLET